MNIEEILRLERVHGAGAGTPPSGTPRPGANVSAFDEVLRELQTLGDPDVRPQAADGEKCCEDDRFRDFADAMSRAEDDFQLMMELRRKLEDAFRSQHGT
jgi:hypothetical protein